MSQENQVLRCFSCETFQVHIVKKAKKWECKICGVKQSFKRHYGKGTGKDCRNHVMKLNELRAMKSYEAEDEKPEETPPESEPVPVVKKFVSKWTQYLDEEIHSEDENYKPEKKRKLCKDDEISVELGANMFDNDLSNAAGNRTHINTSEAEKEKPKRIKSKNIFDSSLENVEDILNFI